MKLFDALGARGNPPQTGARWTLPFSYVKDLSDGIGYLLNHPISPYPFEKSFSPASRKSDSTHNFAAAQCKRGRSCERPRDGDEGNEGRFL